MIAVDDVLLALNVGVVQEPAKEIEFASADLGIALRNPINGAIMLFEQIIAACCPLPFRRYPC